MSVNAPLGFFRTVFPHVPRRTRASLERAAGELVRELPLAPRIERARLLPENPRFVLVANHYQRKGLWIAFAAAVITRAIIARYGPSEPPIRWVVTANWPPLRVAGLRIPSPGDFLLPRVAHALWCYDVPFAGSDPRRTAASIRRLLRDAATGSQPFGLFPEGVAGTATNPEPPLPGSGRLLRMLAARGYPAVPARIYEAEGRLAVRFGEPVPAPAVAEMGDPAEALLDSVRRMI